MGRACMVLRSPARVLILRPDARLFPEVLGSKRSDLKICSFFDAYTIAGTATR
jgi:hypothetical protein